VLNGILRVTSELRASTDVACEEAIIASPERINLLVKEGWQIYFNPRKDAESQIIRLLAVIKEDSFREKRKNLEYLDVRFTRVYLKEKILTLTGRRRKKKTIEVVAARCRNIVRRHRGEIVKNYGILQETTLCSPGAKTPFALSRSKVDMFLKCPRCFYLDVRLGIKMPSMPAFTLNSAVDHLLKKEFDIRRANGTVHPLMAAYGIDAVPAQHNELEIWRENFKGIRVLHPETNFELFRRD